MKYNVVLILCVLSVFSSCTITKRKHLSGFYVTFNKSYGSQFCEERPDEQKECKAGISELQVADPITIKIQTLIPLHSGVKKQLELDKGNFLAKSSFVDQQESTNKKTDLKLQSPLKTFNVKQVKNDDTQPEKKLSKGWRTFWVTILVIVLFGTFVVCGALWPGAYVIWFGLTALLALFGIQNAGEPMKWGERIGMFFAFLALAAFYLFIPMLLASPFFWTFLLLELALYLPLGLLFTVMILKENKMRNGDGLK